MASVMPGQQGAGGMAAYAPPLTAAERSARSVFVGNIPYEATEEQLKEIFMQAGPVVSFRLVYDRETGKPKGYGFCEYQDIETAQSAMRNLNNFDFHGRPLRVGVAAGEQNKEELKSMQQALGGPPVESPYGDPVEPDKAPEAISKAVASLPPEQMFELMKQMKLCIQNNPNEARNMLLQNPQLAYALLQAQIVMKIVDPQVAVAMLNRQNEQIPPLMPSDGQPVNQKPPDVPANNMGAPPQQMDIGGFGGVQHPQQQPQQPQPGFGGVGVQPPSSMGGMQPGGMGRGIPAQQMEMMGQRGPPGGPMAGPAGRGRGGPHGLLGERPMMQEQMGPGGPMPGPGGRGDMGGPPPRGHMGGGPPGAGGGPIPGIGGRHGADMDMRADHRGGAPIGGPGMPGPGGPMPGQGGPMPGQGGPMPGQGGPMPGPGGPMPGPGGPMPGPGGPMSNDPRSRMGGPPQAGAAMMSRGGPAPGAAPPGGPAGQNVSEQDQEKAALIMQVLQLSDQQIAMLPPEQRQSILILKEQIARSAGQGAP